MKRMLALVLAILMVLSMPMALAEDGPLTPYTDTVVVNMMMKNDPNVPFFNGETQDENVVEKFFRDYLNIDFQATWLVDSTQYDSQLNNAIMSNDLPDMFVASKSQVYSMAINGQLTDMTDIYNSYISDSAREVVEFQDGVALEPVTIDGRLYAIPLPNDFSDEITVMYIRNDWMTKLGLEPPKTLDDVVNMAIAFATQDPDGDGVDDTFGIATDTWLNYIAELIGHPLGAYRDIWLANDKDMLEYSNIQPEFKEMLKVINKLYHAGGIDDEYAVKDINSMANDIARGDCGIYPGSFWAIYWMLNMSMDNQIEADWRAYPVIARDDGSYLPRALDTTYRFLVVRKGYEHPEAAVKSINLWQEMWQGQYAEQYWSLSEKDSGYDTDVKYYSPIFFDPPYKNVLKAQHVKAAMASGDPSALRVDERLMYDHYTTALAENNVKTTWTCKTDIDVFTILKDDYQMKFQYSDFGGPQTTEISEYSSLVSNAITGMINDMIMGAPEELDAKWDTYVQTWLDNGGQDWTDAVNEWYATKKAE